jgi:hypothetical protein
MSTKRKRRPPERAIQSQLHNSANAPVCDDAVLDGVLQREDTALALCLIAHVAVLLAHANHDSHVSRPSDDCGEDGSRSVVATKPGLMEERT